MAKVKTKVPTLANATPEFLIDEIGKLRDIQKKAKKQEAVYREAFDVRMRKLKLTTVTGEEYTGAIEKSERTSLVAAKVREILTEDQLEECTQTTEVNKLKVTKIGEADDDDEE